MWGDLLRSNEVIEQLRGLHWGEVDGVMLALERVFISSVGRGLIHDLLLLLELLPKKIYFVSIQLIVEDIHVFMVLILKLDVVLRSNLT